MAHWFHRNPFKATSPLSFDLGRQASLSTQARKICSDIRQARIQLLDLLPNPGHDVTIVKKAAEKYISYLDGFIHAVEDPQAGQQKQEKSQPQAESNSLSIQDSGSNSSASASGGSKDSKLRNAVKVTWTNTLGGKNIFQFDFIFEEINILFNVALWFTKHAAKLAAGSEEISEDDAKEVHRSLREAAGIFQYIQEKLVSRLFEIPGDGSDLDQRILSAYEIQCKAEAQEVTIARAIELKHAPSLIAVLSSETSKLFMRVDETLKTLDEKLVLKWRKYFQFKAAFYMSYAHCYNGNTLLNKDKGGEAVRALKESYKLYQKTEELAREYAKVKGPGTVAKPQQHPFFLRLGPIVHRILEKTQRENGMIYHAKVPEELPEIESKSMFGLANPVEYEPPARSPDWTPAAYNGFTISQANKKADDKEETVKSVKEVPIEQNDKHPNNSTGCVVS